MQWLLVSHKRRFPVRNRYNERIEGVMMVDIASVEAGQSQARMQGRPWSVGVANRTGRNEEPVSAERPTQKIEGLREDGSARHSMTLNARERVTYSFSRMAGGSFADRREESMSSSLRGSI